MTKIDMLLWVAVVGASMFVIDHIITKWWNWLERRRGPENR